MLSDWLRAQCSRSAGPWLSRCLVTLVPPTSSQHTPVAYLEKVRVLKAKSCRKGSPGLSVALPASPSSVQGWSCPAGSEGKEMLAQG